MSETAATYDKLNEKREAILEAALELFADRGFHGTAVPLIAEKAGVGAGTIYRYFESKEALVNALYQRWKGELGRQVLDEFPFDASAREQFRTWWNRQATFASENPTAFAFLELHHHAPYLDKTSRKVEEALLAPALAFMEEARKHKDVKNAPADVLIAVAFGAFLGMAKASCVGELTLTPEVVSQAEQCAWDAISRH